MGMRNKILDLQDAVSLVHANDTISVSGFVAQSSPETLLESLGKRFVDESAASSPHTPKNLTVFFGGGPGGMFTI